MLAIPAITSYSYSYSTIAIMAAIVAIYRFSYYSQSKKFVNSFSLDAALNENFLLVKFLRLTVASIILMTKNVVIWPRPIMSCTAIYRLWMGVYMVTK